MEKESVYLFVIPALTSNLEKTHIYRLSDMAYGEWIILEDNKPRYYVNIFDDLYKEIREWVQNHKIDVSILLERSIEAKGLNLSLSETFRVSRLWESKETSEEFMLEKFPPHFFDIE